MPWRDTGDIDRTGRVTLGGQGGGTIHFEVRHANEKWECDGIVVTSSQGLGQEPYPVVQVHDGAVGPGTGSSSAPSDGQRTGGSWTGNMDVLSGRWMMDCGKDLNVTFSGGIPGTICTARITGKSYLWR